MDYESAPHRWCSIQREGGWKTAKRRKPFPLLCSRGSWCSMSRFADRGEGATLPVDKNNNGCARNTKAMRSGRQFFFFLLLQFVIFSPYTDTCTELRPVSCHEFQSHAICCIRNVIITWAPPLITGNPVSELSVAVITSPASFQPVCLNVSVVVGADAFF